VTTVIAYILGKGETSADLPEDSALPEVESVAGSAAIDQSGEVVEIPASDIPAYGSDLEDFEAAYCAHIEAQAVINTKNNQRLLDAVKTGGVTKVNVATILSISFIEGFVKAHQTSPSEKDFRKFGAEARKRVKDKTKEYMRLLTG